MALLKFPTKSSDEICDVLHIEAKTHTSIPLAVEKVSAGFPSPAQDYIDKKIDLNTHLIRNANATFLVRVASLSMRDAGIDIDDILIVDRSLNAKHNDIVIALIDNDFTLKRLKIKQGICWLKAENPDFNDIHLTEFQDSMIWGVVTSSIKHFR